VKKGHHRRKGENTRAEQRKAAHEVRKKLPVDLVQSQRVTYRTSYDESAEEIVVEMKYSGRRDVDLVKVMAKR